MSDNYQKYFDTRLGLLPDRSVVTFRRIENHQHGCPEAVDQNVGEAPPAAELVRRIELTLPGLPHGHLPPRLLSPRLLRSPEGSGLRLLRLLESTQLLRMQGLGLGWQ